MKKFKLLLLILSISLIGCDKEEYLDDLSPVFERTVKITPDQLHSGFDTPIVLVPSPGLDSGLVLADAVFQMEFNSKAYLNNTSIRISYDGEPVKILGYIGNALSGEQDKAEVFNIQGGPLERNKALVLYVRNGNAENGDSPAWATVYYRINTIQY